MTRIEDSAALRSWREGYRAYLESKGLQPESAADMAAKVAYRPDLYPQPGATFELLNEPARLVPPAGHHARFTTQQSVKSALLFEAAPEAAQPIKDAAAQAQPPKARAKPSHLVPHRHHQGDFFIADILDAIPKGDMASMEHPLFALKSGDMRVRTYERNGVTVTIKPGHDGCATIHDKDVWIYCVSQLVEAMNRGREDLSRVVRFTAYDFLVSTNRRTDGDAYERMKDALDRLRGTSINTNIETDGFREARGFGLVDSWRVVAEKAGRMVAVEVTLPEWLWRSVKAKHVLTLSRDYFRIRKPLDRRIYEIARKHCGAQPKWHVSLAVLHEKSGSTAPLRNFRGDLRKLAGSNELPDYRVVFDAESDAVTFYSRSEKGRTAQITDLRKILAGPCV